MNLITQKVLSNAECTSTEDPNSFKSSRIIRLCEMDKKISNSFNSVKGSNPLRKSNYLIKK